jgi:hypothetical protein
MIVHTVDTVYRYFEPGVCAGCGKAWTGGHLVAYSIVDGLSGVKRSCRACAATVTEESQPTRTRRRTR